MIHISQVSVSCIVGHHDNNSLNENVVVLFSKHLYKSYMAQSLWIADSDRGPVEGQHNTDVCPHPSASRIPPLAIVSTALVQRRNPSQALIDLLNVSIAQSIIILRFRTFLTIILFFICLDTPHNNNELLEIRLIGLYIGDIINCLV